MSIWSEFGFGSADDVSENPFRVELDEYNVNVSAEMKTKDDGSAPVFVFNYTIIDGAFAGLGANRRFSTKPLGPGDDPEWESKNVRTISNLKKTLIELGFNAEQINAWKLNSQFAGLVNNIKGRAVIGPQKSNPDFNQVSSFTRNANATQNVQAPSAVQTPPDFVQSVMPQAVNAPASGAENGFANLFPGVVGS